MGLRRALLQVERGTVPQTYEVVVPALVTEVSQKRVRRGIGEARSIGLYTKNPIGVAFDEADNTKIATYWGRWANSKGQYGPWSSAVSMTIAA